VRGRLAKIATSELLLVVVTLLLFGALFFGIRRLGRLPMLPDDVAENPARISL
jgi:hypothetical protein